MNTEQQVWKGQLSDAEKEIREVELRMGMARDTLRTLLNPVGEVGDIESDKVFDQAIQFRDLALKLADVRKTEKNARQALGM